MTTKKHDDTDLPGRLFTGLAWGAGAGAATLGLPADARAGEDAFRPSGRAPLQRPNILFIIADDLGWADLSCFGATSTQTPHLDRLAREGLRFTNAYSGSAVCSPTRFAFYTGRYPARLPGGLPEPIGQPGEQIGIPPEHPTLASLLKGVGYETAMVGKWHCGFLPWFSPLKSGWDEFFGNFSGAIDYFSHVGTNGQPDLFEDEVPTSEIGYYTNLVTEHALRFIERPHARPWLLNLNFTTPHWPWEGPHDEEESARVTALAQTNGQALFHFDGGSLDIFSEMVTSLDDAVGAVLKALARTRQERDTIVVFTSDNGGERFSYQWPLRDSKGSLYEGGIRVPNILRWPGVIGRRQVTDVPIVIQDWAATLIDVAGATPHPSYPLDGVTLAPWLLFGQAPPTRDLFWRMRGRRGLRRGDWKYVSNTAASGALTHELFHLATDPSERANLAARDPERLATLRAAWEAVDAGLLPYP